MLLGFVVVVAGARSVSWIARWFKYLAAEPEVGSLISPLGLLKRGWTP